MSYKVYETDWLASHPIFYNEKTGEASDNMNDVIVLSDFTFHPEGFNNYLDYGYSVFGQTPIQDVKILPPNSRLEIIDGQIEIESLPDPVEEWACRTTSPEESIERLRDSIQSWEKTISSDIVIPTSGGYDSRILNYFIKDKSRIHTFTYGISKFQDRSFEVNYAKKVSAILNTKWQCIKLQNFHQYFEDWDKLFGVSTHSHGMYHIEFYTKIAQIINTKGMSLMSGIFGDVWAGSIPYTRFSSVKDLIKLSYSHSMHADSSYSLLKDSDLLKEQYFSQNKEKLNDACFQIVEIVRLKMILICYLLKIPKEICEFNVWSPFLSSDVALSMLSISSEYRKNRKWQRDFFANHGLAIENMNVKGSRLNDLNHQAMMCSPLKPLDVKTLSQVIESDYVEWINRKVRPITSFTDILWSVRRIPKFSGGLKRIGCRDPRLKAYFAYLTLKPIESLLLARNKRG